MVILCIKRVVKIDLICERNGGKIDLKRNFQPYCKIFSKVFFVLLIFFVNFKL